MPGALRKFTPVDVFVSLGLDIPCRDPICDLSCRAANHTVPEISSRSIRWRGEVSIPGQQCFDLLDGIGRRDVRQHIAQVVVRLKLVGLGGFDQTVGGGARPQGDSR